MADDSGIDPRYAAQFQRGFDPAQHPTAAPVKPTPSGPVRLAGGPVASAERVPDGPIVRPRVVAPAEPVRISSEAAHDEGDEAADEEPVPWWRRRPIAEWVLLAASLLLVVLAFATFAEQVERQNEGFGPDVGDALVYLLVMALPGPLFLGGVVGLLLWVALRAVDARRRA